jgi:hypothetical protein
MKAIITALVKYIVDWVFLDHGLNVDQKPVLDLDLMAYLRSMIHGPRES